MKHTTNRQQGQVLVLFALGLVGFLALLGLVIDGGFLYVQRRTAQTAADAGALAGARALRELSTVSAINSAAVNAAQANTFGTQPTVTCVSLVDTNGSWLATLSGSGTNCPIGAASSLNGASGVHVDVQISYPTIIASMLRITSLTADGQATAQLGIPGGLATNDAPLIVCGGGTNGAAGAVYTGPTPPYNPATIPPATSYPTYTVGPNTGYVLEQFLTTDSSGNVVIDPQKNGHVYYIKGQYIGHWSTTMSGNTVDNGCGAQSNKFDGGAVSDQTITLPGQLYGLNGNSVANIGAQVEAPGGCSGGTNYLSWNAGSPGCVMWLPVTNAAISTQSNQPLFNIPLEAAFYVWCNKSSNSVCQEWVGQLLANEEGTGSLLKSVSISGTSLPTGIIAVHLTL
jgi:Flp pilus assembly protein TadG